MTRLPPLSPSLLRRQTPAVRAALAASRRTEPKGRTVLSSTSWRETEVNVVLMNMELPSLANLRGEWRKAKVVRETRRAIWRFDKRAFRVEGALAGVPVPPLPLAVEIVRVAPRMLDETVNLPGSAKAVEDAIAAWCGVDDRHIDRVRYTVRQEKGEVAVRIRIVSEKQPAE